jgi:hypothetical protein
MYCVYAVTINPTSAVVAFAVLIGASARVAVLLWQGKQIFPRRRHSSSAPPAGTN